MLKAWQDRNLWQKLFEFIREKKIEEKKKRAMLIKQKMSNDAASDSFIKGTVMKGFQFLGKGLSKIKDIGTSVLKFNQTNDQKTYERQVMYMVLEEINMFFLNLDLSSDFATDLIIHFAAQSEINADLITKLVEKQENKKNSQLRRALNSYKTKKKNIENKIIALQNNEDRALFAIKKSLKFLTYADKPHHLLLVSRKWHRMLEDKVHKVYLMRDDNAKWLNNHRVDVWLTVAGVRQMTLDYVKMKSEVGLYAEIDTSIEEVIRLDVHRSLHIHQKKLSSSVLQSLLRVYAFYHPDISYCQGMNYIAGYLYLMINDEEMTYKMFANVINNYFGKVFSKDFEQLKVMFYQFERLLSIFLPELSDHFKQERVDSG